MYFRNSNNIFFSIIFIYTFVFVFVVVVALFFVSSCVFFHSSFVISWNKSNITFKCNAAFELLKVFFCVWLLLFIHPFHFVVGWCLISCMYFSASLLFVLIYSAFSVCFCMLEIIFGCFVSFFVITIILCTYTHSELSTSGPRHMD